jgi:basic membrane protein A
MGSVAPHSVLTSVIWDWSVYYSAAVRRLMDGTWTGEDYYGGLGDGLVKITEPGSFCTQESIVREEQAEKDILDGKLKMFYGKIRASNGDVIGKDGTSLDIDYIREKMNWYYKNVETLIMRRDNR